MTNVLQKRLAWGWGLVGAAIVLSAAFITAGEVIFLTVYPYGEFTVRLLWDVIAGSCTALGAAGVVLAVQAGFNDEATKTQFWLGCGAALLGILLVVLGLFVIIEG